MLTLTFDTVNSEIFARVLFSRNFAEAEFRENKSLAKGESTLSFLMLVNLGIFYMENVFLNAIRENKILAKISEFTVLFLGLHCRRLV